MTLSQSGNPQQSIKGQSIVILFSLSELRHFNNFFRAVIYCDRLFHVIFLHFITNTIYIYIYRQSDSLARSFPIRGRFRE